MARFRHNAERMLQRRGPYEAFALTLALALFVSGEWIAAALVALFLIWARDRVIRDDV